MTLSSPSMAQSGRGKEGGRPNAEGLQRRDLPSILLFRCCSTEQAGHLRPGRKNL
ncbi:hypothetical protein HMPREF0262_01214 [Clostridium sp. ATCC 29733]|nr:hypothetical protein HMPREF0262_01214 [Clostridium sp. ATCC 29733]